MKKQIHKLLAVALAVIMLFSLVPLSIFTASAATNHSQAEAVEWIKARGNESWWQDVDGVYGCQCVDLVLAYYRYLVGYNVSGNACDYRTNGLPSGWYRDSNPTPGSIIVWAANSNAGGWYTGPYGHIGLVYSVSGSTVYTVETNTVGDGSGNYGEANAKFKTRVPQNATYIHPDFTSDTTPPSNVRLSLEKTSFYTDEHVTYYCSGDNVSYYYISIYDANGNVVETPRLNPGEYVTRYYGAGTYTAYCEAYNSIGHTISNTLSFTVKNRNNPEGYVDSIVGGGGTVTVRGWTFERNDVTKSLDVHVYIGGSSASSSAECYVVHANLSRKDIDNAYGVGEFHGYDTVLTTKKRGNQEVYVYAINIGGGENVELGHGTVNITNPTGTEMTSGYDRVLDDGVYIIANAASPDYEKSIYVLDIENIDYPAKDSTNISLYGPNTTKSIQYYDMWEIAYQKDGFYTIKQFGTNVALDVEGASVLHAANVIACGYHGGSNQLWAISKSAQNGKNYRIQAKCSGMSLDVNNGGTVNGTNIQQCGNNDTAAQGWVFIKHNHSYGAWQTEKEAACTQNGSKKRICQYCGYTQTETIPATGHNYTSVVTQPTCSKQGYTTNTCSICGARYIDNYTELLKHTPSDWITDTPAQPGVAGSKHKECTVCGTILETETIPSLEKPVTPPDETAPQIVIDSKSARPGGTVDVNIALKNNPGIASLKLKVDFNSDLTLTSVIYNGSIGGNSQLPQAMDSPVILNWYNGAANSNGDFIFATLTFNVNDNAQTGNKSVTVDYDPDDIYNIDENNIEFAVVGGNIEVISYIPGDINGDDKVNNKDLTRLFQYLSNWNVTVNEAALDVNGDGKVNNKDLTRLFQYLSNWDVPIF